MIRCKNCGWDKNPAGNVKCVKCNAPLENSMVDDFATIIERQAPSEDYNPRQTTHQCKFQDCGYPLRSSDADCPNCGRSQSAQEKPESRKNDPQKPATPKNEAPKQTVAPSRTIIIDEKSGFGESDKERRKLTGFLVTYSISANGDFFPLYEGINRVGRAASNDVVVADDTVSGEHLVIAYYPQNRKFYFEMVGLTQNGTYVNDKFFPKGGDELKNFDLITIGSTKLIFIAVPETAFS